MPLNHVVRLTSFLCFLLPVASFAQVVPSVLGQQYLAVVGDASQGGSCVAAFVGPCISPGRGIPLDYYATSSSVSAQFGTVNNQITSLNTQALGFTNQFATMNSQIAGINGQLVGINTEISNLSSQTTGFASQFANINGQFANLNNEIAAMNGQISQTLRFTSAVAAMRDAIPAPGDRFAIRLNTASVNGIVAGGFSASANLDDHVRFSVDYGGTRGQSVFSGGVNLSFN